MCPAPSESLLTEEQDTMQAIISRTEMGMKFHRREGNDLKRKPEQLRSHPRHSFAHDWPWQAITNWGAYGPDWTV